jgi:selenoprotein W-related protein
LAEKILKFKQKLGSLKLVPSGGGAFEVSVNGRKIYSKLQSGEFPEPEQIIALLRKELS